jgi:hypothetical protein
MLLRDELVKMENKEVEAKAVMDEIAAQLEEMKKEQQGYILN